MSRRSRLVLGLIALVALVAAVGAAYIFVSGGSGEASAPISAPTLDAATLGDNEAALASGDARVFNIVAEESEARFILNEVLRGQPTTVVGSTNQVAGQVFVNFENPTESEIGPIRVNVRTLATDSGMRDRMIRSQILRSAEDAFEFAEFTPTEIQGLPETITVGQPLTFQVLGNLTVQDVTQPVTFEASVTPVSEDRLEGQASTTVLRSDYGLQIPSVPQVADVTDEVRLEIDFVAQEEQ